MEANVEWDAPASCRALLCERYKFIWCWEVVLCRYVDNPLGGADGKE